MGALKINDQIQIKIKMLNSSQEPLASTKAPNQDLKDIVVLCKFKFRIESQNLKHGCIKDQWLYPNHYQDSKLQSGAFIAPNKDLKEMLSKAKDTKSLISSTLQNPNQDLEDMYVCWTFINMIVKIWKKGSSNTSE